MRVTCVGTRARADCEVHGLIGASPRVHETGAWSCGDPLKTTIAVDGVGLVPLVARIADVGERPLRVPRGLKVWFSRGLNIHEPTCWSAFGARADISRPAGYMLICVRKKRSLDNLKGGSRRVLLR